MDRVRVTMLDGKKYEGNLQTMNEECRQLVMANVENCATGRVHPGLLNFMENEIASIEIIEKKTDTTHEVVNSIKGLTVNSRTNNEERKNEIRKECKIVMIDKLDETFEKAVNFIFREKIIGLALEGVSIGRRGKLYLLQIRAGNVIFLFDMLHLAFEFFKSGLKALLEEGTIQKVIHDCRRASDMLHHQFGVDLVNLYDTQVVDILSYKMENERNFLPRYVRNLPKCLEDYLELGPEEIYTPPIDMDDLDDEEMQWKDRPLSEKMKTAAVQNVKYLRDLRMETMQRYMTQIANGVDIYLSHVRDTREDDLSMLDMTVVPEAFKSLVKTSRFHAYNKNHTRSAFSNKIINQNQQTFRIPYGSWEPLHQRNQEKEHIRVFPRLHPRNRLQEPVPRRCLGIDGCSVIDAEKTLPTKNKSANPIVPDKSSEDNSLPEKKTENTKPKGFAPAGMQELNIKRKLLQQKLPTSS